MWDLVGYLALHRAHWVSREEIADALWPGADSDHAKQSLRQTLLLCTKAFGNLILIDRKALKLDDESCECDIWIDGVQSNFFELSSDQWILDARNVDLVSVYEVPERVTDPGLIFLEKLQGTEFDQLATSQFQMWMSQGRLSIPIQVLKHKDQSSKLSLRGNGLLAILLAYSGAEAEATMVLNKCQQFEGFEEDIYYLYGSCLTHHGEYRLDIALEYAKKVIKRVTVQDPVVQFGVVSTICVLTPPSYHLPLAKKFLELARRNQFEEYACHLEYYFALDETRSGNPKARDRLDRMKRVLTQSGREGTTNKLLARVGQLFELLGHLPEAEDSYLTALAQSKQTNGTSHYAEVLNYVAEFYTTTGRLNEALSFHTQCITLRRDFGHRWGLATSLRGAGYVSKNLELYDQAEVNLKESLRIYEQLGDQLGCASVLSILSTCFYRRRHYQKALRCTLTAKRIIANETKESLATKVPVLFLTHEKVEQTLKLLKESMTES